MYRKVNRPNDPKTAECPECHSTRLLYKSGKLVCTNCDHVISATFNKYGAKKSTYNGYNYDSKFESQVAQDLDLRLKVGDIKEVRKQVKMPFYMYDKLITNYFIDFVVVHNDDHLEYIEAKGYETDVWKMKWKMLEAFLAYTDPTAEMTLIKQKTWKKFA